VDLSVLNSLGTLYGLLATVDNLHHHTNGTGGRVETDQIRTRRPVAFKSAWVASEYVQEIQIQSHSSDARRPLSMMFPSR